MKPTIFDGINEWIRQSESSLVNLLSSIAPWGAPLAPAYMSYGGMITHLRYDPIVALIVASVIEILGLATVHTTIIFWQFNRQRLAEYKKQPTTLAGSMFVFYLFVVLSVNVLMELPLKGIYLDYMPIVARGLLSMLTIPAAITLSIRTQHNAILSDMAKVKSSKLTGNFPELTGKLPESSNNAAETYRQDYRKLPDEDRQIVASMSIDQIVGKYRVSERTARNWKRNSQDTP